MADPFLGEIHMFGGNFAPNQWATCDGQTLPINQNQALFSLLGTTYGGDGQVTFALPDLQGRTALHAGTGNGLTTRSWGEKAGSEGVALSVNEMPAHTHTMQGRSLTATTMSPSGQLLATPAANARYTTLYATTGTQATMDSSVIGNSGGNQAHANRQPLLALNPCIALIGQFPSRN